MCICRDRKYLLYSKIYDIYLLEGPRYERQIRPAFGFKRGRFGNSAWVLVYYHSARDESDLAGGVAAGVPFFLGHSYTSAVASAAEVPLAVRLATMPSFVVGV